MWQASNERKREQNSDTSLERQGNVSTRFAHTQTRDALTHIPAIGHKSGMSTFLAKLTHFVLYAY